ncbi:polyprenyl synthetase family protein [Sinomonas atrocyanea]|uniref:polyprenyl synthetase family protein n=1 Tax=Sinomonas atrocyanea TaxID=37927 RepID=UPI00277EBC7E|nr:geranylgeranyl diphosphate synthase type I [Sinomonas atrocyanea]MDR6620091.1 geranylgeranyl diphosphate synthase type I [Sinomonas atrocyanea]
MNEQRAAAAGVEEEQARYREALEAELRSFLDRQRSVMAEVSADVAALMDAISGLVSGGKRLRALLGYWGWRGAGGAELAAEPIRAGAALELFQAAALIHDDIIDRSATRRGAPSVHERFTALHARSGWALDAARFGHAAAILTGDLCLSFSEEAFTGVGPAAGIGTPGRRIFNTMRAEVMAGQYLDILEEVAGPTRPRTEAVARAGTVIRYKSAKYSTEHPLGIGGALAGADEALLAAYSAFSLPLGEAFQLRDDVLGVFGDPAATGKPAGDDLREGKRTMLVALALDTADGAAAAELERGLGRGDLDLEEVGRLRDIISSTGALGATERLIDRLADEAFSALARLDVGPVVSAALEALGKAAVRRAS